MDNAPFCPDPIHDFTHRVRLQLHDTDGAGVLFYGHLFRYLHDTYESFMGSIGYPLQGLIRPADPAAGLSLPIVHAEADYRRPLRHGDALRITLRVAEVRPRSFELEYTLTDDQGRGCGRGRTVHVMVVPETAGPPRLPEGLRRALLARTAESGSDRPVAAPGE